MAQRIEFLRGAPFLVVYLPGAADVRAAQYVARYRAGTPQEELVRIES